MSRTHFSERLYNTFGTTVIVVDENFVLRADLSQHARQQHTNNAFSEKWQKYEQSNEKERLYQYQRDWYLKLYGFGNEAALAQFLRTKTVSL